jgi:hypothetical protein
MPVTATTVEDDLRDAVDEDERAEVIARSHADYSS